MEGPLKGSHSQQRVFQGPGTTKLHGDRREIKQSQSDSAMRSNNSGHADQKKAFSMHQDIGLSKSMDFRSETKFVMLNFMGMVPEEMFRGHISTSPDVEEDDTVQHIDQRFARSQPVLTKSRSLSACTRQRPPTLRHLRKFKTLHREIDSPASEDNLNFKYKKFQEENNVIYGSFQSGGGELESPGTEYVEPLHQDHDIPAVRSTPVSPRKNTLFQRQCSDTSSPGDYSYASDADDEYDGSNASSTFSSSRSFNYHDGFLDLRRSAQTLPTVQDESQETCVNEENENEENQEPEHIKTGSNDEDEVDTFVPHSGNICIS